MPYTPTWNNPYLSQNPYQPVMPSQTMQPYQQPVNGKPYENVLRVIDEHLETIRLLYPKTYDSVLARIRELG